MQSDDPNHHHLDHHDHDGCPQAVVHSAVLAGGGGEVGHIKALLQAHPANRADVNVMMQPSGQTAIHMAAERGLSECLR